jgi:hypothetical protein
MIRPARDLSKAAKSEKIYPLYDCWSVVLETAMIRINATANST